MPARYVSVCVRSCVCSRGRDMCICMYTVCCDCLYKMYIDALGETRRLLLLAVGFWGHEHEYFLVLILWVLLRVQSAGRVVAKRVDSCPPRWRPFSFTHACSTNPTVNTGTHDTTTVSCGGGGGPGARRRAGAREVLAFVFHTRCFVFTAARYIFV